MSGALAGARHRLAGLLPRADDLAAMAATPGRDLLAGVTVGLVALPLALAFGISSGLGATAGIVTAIVAGAAAAFFGGSHVQVSGPTGAMTVVLIPIVATHGPDGVLVVGLLAGLGLVAMAMLRLGRLVRYIPLPVIEGFTLGIAVIIGLQQLPAALGVTASGERVVAVVATAAADWARAPHWWPVGMAAAVAALMLGLGRLRPGLPASLVAVLVATAAAELLDLDVARIGALPTGLPAPHLPTVPWTELHELVLPALAVTALAALESLLSATVADAMTVDGRHDPDRELFGQGVANLASPLFGGIPATAAIARTAVNVRSGARSRLAAINHAGVLLLIVLLLAPQVARIPLAALAGVLLATSVRMVEVSSLRSLLRSSRGDGAVLVCTAVATVALDLVTAVVLGMVAAGALALQRVSRAVTLERVPGGDHGDEHRSLLDAGIVAYRLDGPLFFGGAHQALLELSSLSDVRVVILRMARVGSLDATGAAVLRDTITDLERRGTTVLLSGVRSEHATMLDAIGVYRSLAGEHHLFGPTPDAIAHARLHAEGAAHRDSDSTSVSCR